MLARSIGGTAASTRPARQCRRRTAHTTAVTAPRTSSAPPMVSSPGRPGGLWIQALSAVKLAMPIAWPVFRQKRGSISSATVRPTTGTGARRPASGGSAAASSPAIRVSVRAQNSGRSVAYRMSGAATRSETSAADAAFASTGAAARSPSAAVRGPRHSA
ncbi:MAG: hypothetical protein IPG72_06180 [Ardenticatenales bacterium]|nr:hypothetical protein [Ardenticatenales bacterium]